MRHMRLVRIQCISWQLKERQQEVNTESQHCAFIYFTQFDLALKLSKIYCVIKFSKIELNIDISITCCFQSRNGCSCHAQKFCLGLFLLLLASTLPLTSMVYAPMRHINATCVFLCGGKCNCYCFLPGYHMALLFKMSFLYSSSVSKCTRFLPYQAFFHLCLISTIKNTFGHNSHFRVILGLQELHDFIRLHLCSCN